MADRKSSQGTMEAQLQEWGAKLDGMKAKADQVGADKKAELNAKIESLAAKRDALAKQLSALKDSSDDAWESLKSGMQDAWQDLGKAFEDAASKFNQD
jgi:uncharacterized coiled-coil DUF342 family protein